MIVLLLSPSFVINDCQSIERQRRMECLEGRFKKWKANGRRDAMRNGANYVGRILIEEGSRQDKGRTK